MVRSVPPRFVDEIEVPGSTATVLHPNLRTLNDTNGTAVLDFHNPATVYTLNLTNGGTFTNGGVAVFKSAVQHNTTVTNIGATYTGSGAGLSALNGSAVTSGTIPIAQINSAFPTNQGTLTINGIVISTGAQGQTVASGVTITGNTNLNITGTLMQTNAARSGSFVDVINGQVRVNENNASANAVVNFTGNGGNSFLIVQNNTTTYGAVNTASILMNGAAGGLNFNDNTTVRHRMLRDGTGVFFSGITASTNGFASYSTNRTTIAATGYTNTLTINSLPVDVDVYFTAATATLSDQNGNLLHTFTTLGTSDLFTHLKPNWRLVTTTGAGDVIAH